MNSEENATFQQINQFGYGMSSIYDFQANYDNGTNSVSAKAKKRAYRQNQSAEAREKRLEKDAERHRNYYRAETEEARIARKTRDAARHREAYLKKKSKIANKSGITAAEDAAAITLLSAAKASKASGEPSSNHIIVPSSLTGGGLHHSTMSPQQQQQLQLQQQRQHHLLEDSNLKLQDMSHVIHTGNLLHQIMHPEQHSDTSAYQRAMLAAGNDVRRLGHNYHHNLINTNNMLQSSQHSIGNDVTPLINGIPYTIGTIMVDVTAPIIEIPAVPVLVNNTLNDVPNTSRSFGNHHHHHTTTELQQQASLLESLTLPQLVTDNDNLTNLLQAVANSRGQTALDSDSSDSDTD